MGKSHLARIFRAMDVPVFDSDAVVHALYGPGGRAVAPVLTAFPGCGDRAGGIDRTRLGALVLGDPAGLRRLEAIVHALVREEQAAFLARQCRLGRWLVVLDVPLLLETGADRRVDRVAVVSAHPLLQRQRALRRPGMTPTRLAAIVAKQMPDAEKRRRAHFVVPSGQDRGLTSAAVERILRELRCVPARAWPARWLERGVPEPRRAVPGQDRSGERQA
jgi:dephospho-CoA kinase